MNISALKAFAPAVRRQLMEAITRKLDFVLLDGRIPSPDAQGEVYRHLVLAACRFYHALLPNLFEKLDDETELLLPDDLLTEHSVVHGFRTEISDEDCGDGQRANVEILGWLYQFYISERKDQVMARKSAVPTEDIPAVTQLFTPHWIVRYLVENSLGRLWLLNRPGSRLREHMPYYIEGEPETDFLKITKPEEIRLCDPAVGSGHMLTYAFDLLTLIYEEEGYAPTEIPALILRHNLHGLEICPRAAQLAELALVFKAREKSRRFFQPEHLVRPHIIELRDVRFAENELRDYIHALGLGDLFNQPMLKLLHQFEEAKNFGSLIQPCLDERAIAFARRAIEAKDLGGQLFLRETHLKVLRVLEQAEALTQRYHVVVANPPYMGYYSSPWLFLSSFESVRRKILFGSSIESMLHMGRGIFGIDWGSVAFVIRKSPQGEKTAQFFRLHKRTFQYLAYEDIGTLFLKAKNDHSYRFDFDEYRDDEGVNEIPALSNPNGLQIFYCAYPSKFTKIPGSPIAYWLSDSLMDAFKGNQMIAEVAKVRGGMTTGDNGRFLRLWYEVSRQSSGTCLASREAAAKSSYKWFPYNKGGYPRRWYGNQDFVVNWKSDGEEIIASGRATPRSKEFYFREALTYSATSSSYFAARYSPIGFVFDAKGSFCIPELTDWQSLLGLLNSKLCSALLEALNPTIEFQAGDISRLPFKPFQEQKELHSALVEDMVERSRIDWDNFETSWNFSTLPLLACRRKDKTIEACWHSWETDCSSALLQMKH